ncbi:hypothetical protein J6590_062799 [Homalodisca vitripennis]|nr:hypothetical protein J6590_062799 [Homalodisca vitripennis]
MKNVPNYIVWVWQVFGGLPLKITSGHKTLNELTFSIVGFMWCLILFILEEVLSGIIFYINMTEVSVGYERSRTQKFAMILDLVALQILAASTFFSGTWKYPRIVDVFGTLDQIYQDLQYKNREVKIQVKVIVVLTVTALLFLANFANIVTNNALDFSVLNFFTFLLLDCTQLAFLLQFTHVTESIITGFKTVSNKMREEIICNLIERTVMQRSLADGHICHTTRNTVSKIKKVKSLMKTYWMLCDVVHQANDFYCDQLMAVMFSIFVQVTIKSYFFFMNVRSGYLFAFTMDAVWVLVLICYAILVANSSTEITNSVIPLVEI